jgi:hypothetical protein
MFGLSNSSENFAHHQPIDFHPTDCVADDQVPQLCNKSMAGCISIFFWLLPKLQWYLLVK